MHSIYFSLQISLESGCIGLITAVVTWVLFPGFSATICILYATLSSFSADSLPDMLVELLFTAKSNQRQDQRKDSHLLSMYKLIELACLSFDSMELRTQVTKVCSKFFSVFTPLKIVDSPFYSRIFLPS